MSFKWNLVEIISYLTTVKDFTKHILNCLPIDPTLNIHTIQVVLNLLYITIVVRLVELIWKIPTKRAKLTSLLYCRM